MIIVRLIGGLGNQLFQYAFARYLSFKHNTELKIDIEKQKEYGYREYALHYFNISGSLATEREILNFFPKEKMNNQKLKGILGKRIANYFYPYDYKLEEKLFDRVYNDKNINENTPLMNGKIAADRFFHFDNEALDLPDNIILFGYWLNQKYFLQIEQIIRSEFSFKSLPREKNIGLLNQIKNSNSVFIHIRRGDFLDSNNTSVFISQKTKYYYNCIDYLCMKIESPCFFIFSDEIDWAKENLKIGAKTIYVDNNKNEPIEDFRLMCACKHAITASSSFSWWGAWLIENKNKIVLVPKTWYRLPNHYIDDMVPSNWIRISDE